MIISKDNRTPKELLDIFPEAFSEYILPKTRELKSEIQRLERVAAQELRRVQDLKDGWFIRELVKATVIYQLVEAKRHLNCLKRYFPSAQSKNEAWSSRIERARGYPILDFGMSQLPEIKKCGKAWRSLCPYHAEKSPSFFLYPQTNTFHCFGCGSHGDVIALAQKLLSAGFLEAVNNLSIL